MLGVEGVDVVDVVDVVVVELGGVDSVVVDGAVDDVFGTKSHDSSVQMQIKSGGITAGQHGRGINWQIVELHSQMKPSGIIGGHWGRGADVVGIGTTLHLVAVQTHLKPGGIGKGHCGRAGVVVVGVVGGV